MIEKYQKKIQTGEKIEPALLSLLDAACEGLVYISETDAPVLPFYGSVAANVTGAMILHQTGRKADSATQETDFDGFFERLTTVKDWFGEPEKARAKKFLELKKLLEENLRSVKVFRLGKIQIDIYVVGLDADGRVAGIATKAVET